MACRVIGKPAVSLEIDSGPSPDSRDTRRSRVSSPNAAKTAADSAACGFVFALRGLAKVPFDQLHHNRPALVVRRECLAPPLERDAVEARLADRQHHATSRLLERELDQRRRFLRVVDLPVDGERVPPEREQTFVLDAIDGDLERDRRMLPLRLRHLVIHIRSDDDAAQENTRRKRPVEFHAEPLLEFLNISQRIPDTRPGRAQQHSFFDAIGDDGRHMQPPGCRVQRAAAFSNHVVANVHAPNCPAARSATRQSCWIALRYSTTASLNFFSAAYRSPLSRYSRLATSGSLEQAAAAIRQAAGGVKTCVVCSDALSASNYQRSCWGGGWNGTLGAVTFRRRRRARRRSRSRPAGYQPPLIRAA